MTNPPSTLESFSDRLAWARKNAGFERPQHAAEAFGWNPNTYKSHDYGVRAGQGRAPKEETVKRYARAFKIDWVWLMSGIGSAEVKNVVRLAGRVGAGARVDRDAEQAEMIDIELPFPIAPGLLAFEVTGDSMFPKCEDGDVIVCGPESTQIEEILGRVAAVQTLDGIRYFKRVERGSGPGLYNLESVNPAVAPIRDEKLEWTAAIRTILPRGEWRRLDAETRTRIADRTMRRSAPGF